MSTTSTRTTGSVDHPLVESPLFEHATVETDDTVECTIFPTDCSDEEILTRWITAEGDSFVAVDEMR